MQTKRNVIIFSVALAQVDWNLFWWPWSLSWLIFELNWQPSQYWHITLLTADCLWQWRSRPVSLTFCKRCKCHRNVQKCRNCHFFRNFFRNSSEPSLLLLPQADHISKMRRVLCNGTNFSLACLKWPWQISPPNGCHFACSFGSPLKTGDTLFDMTHTSIDHGVYWF